MNTILLFLVGCMGARLLLTYAAKQANKTWLRYMGFIALLPAVGFLTLFLTGMNKTVGTFGEKIWWNSLRPVHSLLYFLFAYSAIQGNPKAWIFLLIDVTIGFSAFIIFHTKRGDLSIF
jgi:hypothetical protein